MWNWIKTIFKSNLISKNQNAPPSFWFALGVPTVTQFWFSIFFKAMDGRL
jgi:hypothetical protein